MEDASSDEEQSHVRLHSIHRRRTTTYLEDAVAPRRQPSLPAHLRVQQPPRSVSHLRRQRQEGPLGNATDLHPTPATVQRQRYLRRQQQKQQDTVQHLHQLRQRRTLLSSLVETTRYRLHVTSRAAATSVDGTAEVSEQQQQNSKIIANSLPKEPTEAIVQKNSTTPSDSAQVKSVPAIIQKLRQTQCIAAAYRITGISVYTTLAANIVVGSGSTRSIATKSAATTQENATRGDETSPSTPSPHELLVLRFDVSVDTFVSNNDTHHGEFLSRNPSPKVESSCYLCFLDIELVAAKTTEATYPTSSKRRLQTDPRPQHPSPPHSKSAPSSNGTRNDEIDIAGRKLVVRLVQHTLPVAIPIETIMLRHFGKREKNDVVVATGMVHKVGVLLESIACPTTATTSCAPTMAHMDVYGKTSRKLRRFQNQIQSVSQEIYHACYCWNYRKKTYEYLQVLARSSLSSLETRKPVTMSPSRGLGTSRNDDNSVSHNAHDPKSDLEPTTEYRHFMIDTVSCGGSDDTTVRDSSYKTISFCINHRLSRISPLGVKLQYAADICRIRAHQPISVVIDMSYKSRRHQRFSRRRKIRSGISGMDIVSDDSDHDHDGDSNEDDEHSEFIQSAIVSFRKLPIPVAIQQVADAMAEC